MTNPAPDLSLLQLDRAAQDLLFREARTAKRFTSDPVSDEQIATLYDLIKWGPTMTNSQPLRVLLARSDDARARVISHMLPNNQERTASAPLIAVLAADLRFDRNIERVFPGAPYIAQMYQDDGFRELVADSQAWLQAGYFIMGVRALGLDAGPMLGYDRPGLDADLLAGTELRSIMVVNIGRPAPDAYVDRQPRLEFDEVVQTI